MLIEKWQATGVDFQKRLDFTLLVLVTATAERGWFHTSGAFSYTQTILYHPILSGDLLCPKRPRYMLSHPNLPL
jgi:hypothetical protein